MQNRTHTCNELRIQNVGEKVRLSGWVENVREVGGNLAFIVLRDFYGSTQLVAEDEKIIGVIRRVAVGQVHESGFLVGIAAVDVIMGLIGESFHRATLGTGRSEFGGHPVFVHAGAFRLNGGFDIRFVGERLPGMEGAAAFKGEV